MIIREIRLRNYPYKSRIGLAERIVRKLYVSQGFEVFRGHMSLGKEFLYYYDLYENVRAKYDRLESRLFERLGNKLIDFRAGISSGLPDFFVCKKNIEKFVEVKLEHESVKKNQVSTMRFVESFGFDVEVIRVKSKIYREVSNVDLAKNEITVLARQKRFRKF